MKRIILIVLSILLSFTVAMAAPFLVCDPQTGVTHYRLTGPSWVTGTIIAQPDGSIRMDVSAATIGSNPLTVAACNTDAVWGEQCSVAIPFVFSKPVLPSSPVNMRLLP